MNKPIMRALRADGRLQEMVQRAVQDGLDPMLGTETTVLSEMSLPWGQPPAALALVPLAEATASGFRGVVWIGGELDDLASVAAALLGERPSGDDEALQDCVRELTNVLAGRIQEQLRSVGPATGLGLPMFLSGARTLAIGGASTDGIALRIQIGLPELPEILIGFVTGDA